MGSLTETANNRGATHLLEHALFRYGEAADDYLHLFKDHNATVNGVSHDESTEYYGSINFKKGPWLVRKFAEMLFNRTFNPDIVAGAKKVVRMELLEKFKDKSEISLSNLFDKFNFLEKPDYWKREFDAEKGTDPSDDLDGNESLSMEQILEFYKSYYQPQNAIIYVAGNFDKTSINDILSSTFGVQTVSSDLTPVAPKPLQAKKRPYRHFTKRNKRTGTVDIGVQYWNLQPVDRSVLSIYFDNLAQRLNKKFRTEESATYTVNYYQSDRNGIGNMYVSFETEKNQIIARTKEIEEVIQKELFNSELTDEAIVDL